MPKHAHEVTPVAIRNKGDGCISSSPARGDDCQKLAHGVVRSARGREEHAGREWERNGCGGHQSPSAPFPEQIQDCGYFTVSKFTVQISRSGFTCDSKRKGGADS